MNGILVFKKTDKLVFVLRNRHCSPSGMSRFFSVFFIQPSQRHHQKFLTCSPWQQPPPARHVDSVPGLEQEKVLPCIASRHRQTFCTLQSRKAKCNRTLACKQVSSLHIKMWCASSQKFFFLCKSRTILYWICVRAADLAKECCS